MKNLLNKIYIHPFTIINLLVFTLIGQFKLILYYMLLIIFHELGHLTFSIIFKWNINKIIILPFGCLIKYNEKINRSIKEEFIISISGVLFQIVFYLILTCFINYKYLNLINNFIIIFNLIPIYPLDGSKILNIFFHIFTNFKNSILLTSIISFVFIIIVTLVFYKINKLVILALLFLFKETYKLYKERNKIFNKFLLERYLYNFNFHKEIIIDNIDKMKKNYRHVFFINNHYMTEKTYLKKMFDI